MFKERFETIIRTIFRRKGEYIYHIYKLENQRRIKSISQRQRSKSVTPWLI